MFKSTQFTRPTQFEEYSSDKTNSAQVAIYNEDDLSHLLYIERSKATTHGDHVIINEVEHDEPETPFESPLDTGIHTPASDDNESAILSDCETESDLEIPPSPSRLRGGTMSISDDDFEFPIFLGRQEEEELPSATPAPAPLRPALRRSNPPAQVLVNTAGSECKHVQIVPPKHHVAAIEGPLMSWWPEPVEGMEYQWVQRPSKPTIPMEQHVSHVDGPLMSWWPAPIEMMEYEWNERFYE
ncbi:uncharacterized protein JN550_011928 [Neoarthrinium moseri]|uniref:uncharacterized protein n=1 Tax=Neoarthrinium moseri TaxID=1658444 RepID=UPI001FDE0823|nr:uncharacterized protein JN550_011928 [Neoarthrinium moseri]KAI1859620.1 hypothetical protein JN550_011928 [Neoarthrinium moseri]